MRNVTDVTMEVFRDALLAVNWETVYLEFNANCAYESFLRTFKKLYNGSFPYRTVKLCKKLRKPWMTKELLHKVHKKTGMYQRFLNTRDSEDLRAFKRYRKQLTGLLRRAKSAFYNPLYKR